MTNTPNIMNDKTREKLAKIYQLIERGSTEGEKQAARAALDRIIDAHGIDESQLGDLTKKACYFTYVSDLEVQLLLRILDSFIDEKLDVYKSRGGKKLQVKLDYLDAVTIECAYEYFRRHMKSEWRRTCAPLVSRCRTTKGTNKRRKELQGYFLAKYLLESGLIDRSHLTKVKAKDKATHDALERLRDVQGGAYHKQATSGHLLNQ